VFLGELTGASASALQAVFTVRDDLSNSAAVLAYEQDYVAACDAAKPRFLPGGALHCSAESSYAAESDRAIAGDQILMSFAMILMIAYVAVVLSRRDLVESKILLGLTIVLCVGLSLGVAFGICGYAGIPFTQMSMMCIFIIMGVGIDDMFIITDAFAREPRSLPLENRVANALGEVGPSITLTSVRRERSEHKEGACVCGMSRSQEGWRASEASTRNAHVCWISWSQEGRRASEASTRKVRVCGMSGSKEGCRGGGGRPKPAPGS
jgi:hypothetical protein